MAQPSGCAILVAQNCDCTCCSPSHLAGVVEPDHFVLRLEDGIPVAVNVLVGAFGGRRRQRAARTFAGGIAQQLAHDFVGIADGDLAGVLAQLLVVMIGPETPASNQARAMPIKTIRVSPLRLFHQQCRAFGK